MAIPLIKVTGDGVTYEGIGFQGESAYEIAVKNGYTGTETEWLASLVGEQGPQGEQGPAGTSPSASVTQTDTGATVTITDSSGTTTASLTNGTTPVKGTDYWTSADKEEIIADLKSTTFSFDSSTGRLDITL